MPQAFTFPPPPPPPPPSSKPFENNHRPASNGSGVDTRLAATRNGHNSSRGSGGRGSFRARGPSRGPISYGPRRYGHVPTLTHNTHTAESGSQWAQSQYRHRSDADRGKKRDHHTAFHKHNSSAANQSLAPQAVPNFSHDLNDLVVQRTNTSEKAVSTPKANFLGLTPNTQNDSEAESEEEDEEAKLGTLHSDSALQIEYRGNTSTLRTPEDIAAWIAERRKRWPTEAKRDVAKLEAEKKRRLWEEEKAIRAEAAQKAAQQRHEDRLKQRIEQEKSRLRQKMLREQVEKAKSTSVPGQAAEKLSLAQEKAEKLRKKAAKIAAALQKAETALQNDDSNSTKLDAADPNIKIDQLAEQDLEKMLARVDEAAQKHAEDLDVSDLDASSDSDGEISNSSADLEDTSTSGSSSEGESDSDGPPEVSSSRQEVALLKDHTLQNTSSKQQQNQRLCPNLAKTGRCRFGKKCRYSHKRSANSKQNSGPEKRKGLYQIMVEKEQEAERRKALQMIIAMGDRGVFDHVLNS